MGECLIVRRGDSVVIPDGQTVTPTNDVAIWLKCADLNYEQQGSPTLATVVANASLCATLMGSQNACEYMIRSTAIQTAVLGSNTAITALDASGQFVSAYMTAANTPTGYSSSDWKFASYDNQCGAVNLSSLSAYIKLPNPVWPYKIMIEETIIGSSNAVVDVQASNDGSSWNNIAATTKGRHGQWIVMTYIPYASAVKYQYYRWAVSGAVADSGIWLVVRRFRVYGIQ